MDFRLEDLLPDDFENLINILCQQELGTGAVSFSKGKDGGRDGRFTGTANSYPSKKEPWKGKFIIQVKHVKDYNASCSDNSFFGNKTSIINKEIVKIKRLKEREEIDNYLLFTNRKETEKREDAIQYIKNETNLTNVDIIGKATLNNWLLQYNEIAKKFNLGRYLMHLELTDFEIRDVIIAFGGTIPVIKNIATITEGDVIKTISKELKNEINRLSNDYYRNQIKQKSLQYFEDIDDFLSNFVNQEYMIIYHNFAAELSNKIEIKRDSFDKFEDIFLYLYDLIFEKNKIELKKDKRLIWVFLHHLYFNCHIGRIS